MAYLCCLDRKTELSLSFFKSFLYTLKVLNIVYTFEEMVKVFLPYNLT